MKEPTDTTSTLFELRGKFKTEYPHPQQLSLCLNHTLACLFPHFNQSTVSTPAQLESLISLAREAFELSCAPIIADSSQLKSFSLRYVGLFPELHTVLVQDAEAICAGDPAAKGIDEVILSYPGFFAIAVYRIAHRVLSFGIPLIPRMMSEIAHSRTGIDIHPGATIGGSFVIDHGTGIVIGETTEIHDNVKLYQGVTLGALSVSKELTDKKRHPTIERNVVVYANATILGGNTVVGANSTIGGNVWLTKSVPPGSRLYHQQS